MLRYLLFTFAITVMNQAWADQNENIQCIAIYSGFGIALEKRGELKKAEIIKNAARTRASIAKKSLGSQNARNLVLQSPYMKQRRPDEKYMNELKKCMLNDMLISR